MQNRQELGELNDNPGTVFIIIFLAVFVSIAILIWARFFSISPTPKSEETILILDSNNIPTLQLGHYALWTTNSDGAYKFLKRFNTVNAELVSLDGSKLKELTISDYNLAKEFVVTIENEGDRDEQPSLVLMHSPIVDDTLNLAFNITKPENSSSFLLATPTDGNNTINEQSGLWFINEQSTSSLNLPLLPEGFDFEARVINKKSNTFMGMGHFDQVDQEDNLATFSLTQEGFKFPGEDFLTNLPGDLDAPLNLANGDFEVIISIEPNHNGEDTTGEEIFSQLFHANISEGLKPFTSHPLDFTFVPIELNLRIDAK